MELSTEQYIKIDFKKNLKQANLNK